MCLYAMLKWIMLWWPRLLNCTIHTCRQYMTEVFHFLSSYSPLSVTAWWGAIREWWRWLTWLRMHHAGRRRQPHTYCIYIYSRIYIYTYMCSGDIILYGTIVIVCVTHWYILTACWQFSYTTFPYVLKFSTVTCEFNMHGTEKLAHAFFTQVHLC